MVSRSFVVDWEIDGPLPEGRTPTDEGFGGTPHRPQTDVQFERQDARAEPVDGREADAREPDGVWKAELSPDQHQVLRRSATEPPGVGRYVHNHQDGTYHCAGCIAVVFDAGTKFESGSGWPSFYQPAALDASS